MRALFRSPLWGALALFAACAPDDAVAPENTASPLFLLGTTPTNSLLGGTPTFTYNSVDGGVTVELGINRGIYTASRNGNADFRLETQLTLTNDGGQSIVVGGECPLADVKVEFIDDASQLLAVSFSVPWDGNDQNGEPLGGQLTANYAIELVHVNPNRTSVIEARTGSVAVGGSTELIGQTPTSNLVGVNGITYVAGEGFRLRMAANAGLIEAAQMGQAGFRLQVELRVTGADGNGIINGGECPLADIKVDLADPRLHPLVDFDFGVPWDGKDSQENAMTGTVQVSYTAGIVFEPNGADLVTLGSGLVTGFFDVFLGGVLQ